MIFKTSSFLFSTHLLTESDINMTVSTYDNVTIDPIFNYIWTGKSHDAFKQDSIRSLKRFAPPGYQIHLWLDVMSLTSDFDLSYILGTELWTQYNNIQPDRTHLPSTTIPATESTLRSTFRTLCKAQYVFSTYLATHSDYIRSINPTLQFFHIYCLSHNITLHLLDTECYWDWVQWPCSDPRKQLVNWILFERYARGGNSIAVSDLLRIQLLIEQPGFILDIDNAIITSPFPDNITGFVTATVKMPFVQNAMTNSFMGSCEDHPFLEIYRQHVLDNYRILSTAHDFRCVIGPQKGSDYTTLMVSHEMKHNLDSACSLELETANRSGSLALQRVNAAMPEWAKAGVVKNVVTKSVKAQLLLA